MTKLGWLFLLGAISAVGGWFWVRAQAKPVLQESALTFASLQHVTMRDVVSATGMIKPRQTVVVSAEFPGLVTRVRGDVNQIVAEGTILAEIDDRRYKLKVQEATTGEALAESAQSQAQAALSRAKAAEEAARLVLKSQEDLANSGGFRSEREQAQMQHRSALAGIEEAKAGLEAAAAKIKAAKTAVAEANLALQMSQIRVPGVEGGPRRFLILERKLHEGLAVGPQMGPLFVLSDDLEKIELHAQVAEGDINRIRKGLPALFTVGTYGEEEVEIRGVVTEIRPQSDVIKGAVYYDTVIQVTNQRDEATGEWRLRPGMTVSVDIVRNEHSNVWRVPTQAMNFQLDPAYYDDAARTKIDSWKQRPDASDWHALWIWNAQRRSAEPILVRVGGKKNGQLGLKDSEGNEVLEWEAGREPAASQPLSVIIGAPPAKAPGLFDQPANFKVA